MKSLEIINELINSIDECHYKDELNEIKQDLEVLEIIRNKKVNVQFLLQCMDLVGTVEKCLDIYNSALRDSRGKLTLEELLKLKQWLEENE